MFPEGYSSLVSGGQRRVVAGCREVVEVGLKLVDVGGARDVGSDSPDVTRGVVIRLVP